MDHVVDGPDDGAGRGRGRSPTAAWSPRPRCCSPGSGCGWSSSSPTAGPAQRSVPALRDQVCGGAERGPADRLGRAARRAARVPRRLLGPRRRRRSTATPRCSRRCGSRCSTCCRPGARGESRADPGQGADRPRLRRARVLGHRDVRAAGAHATPPRTRPPTRCAGGTATLPLASERAAQLGLRGAAFPWRTISGEECSGYWPAGTAAFHINADIADAVVRYVDATGDEAFDRGRRAGAAGRDRAAVALARATTTPSGGFHIDGVTGPDEYSAIADNNVYTNLMAQQNLRGRGGRRRSSSRTAPRELGVDAEEIGRAGATRPRRCSSRTTRRSACTRRPRASPGTRSGTSQAHAAGPVPAAAALPLLRPVPQAGGQAGRPGAGHAPVRRTRSPPSRRRGTSTTTSRSRCGTRRCRPAPRRCMAAEVGHLDLAYDYLGEAALDGPAATWSTTPATACTSPRWPAPGSRWSRASAACAHGDGTSASRRGCPDGLTRLAFTLLHPGQAAAGGGDTPQRPYLWPTANRSRSCTTARRLTSPRRSR